MTTLDLLQRVNRRDAALIYAYYVERSARLSDLTYDAIAVSLNEAGLLTARDAKWTGRVVRSNLDLLEEVGLIERESYTNGSFDLSILPFVADENGNGNGNAPKVDTYKEYKINNKINSLNCSDSVSENVPNAVAVEPVAEVEEVAETVNDAVAKIDFSNEKIERLREQVVRDIWEPTLHRELVDRITAAVVLGLATTKTVKSAIAEAKDEVLIRKTTNGFKGKRFIWQTLAVRAKSWFDGANYRWTETQPPCEPEPRAVLPVGEAEDDIDAIIASSDSARAKHYTGKRFRLATA